MTRTFGLSPMPAFYGKRSPPAPRWRSLGRSSPARRGRPRRGPPGPAARRARDAAALRVLRRRAPVLAVGLFFALWHAPRHAPRHIARLVLLDPAPAPSRFLRDAALLSVPSWRCLRRSTSWSPRWTRAPPLSSPSTSC